MQSICIALSALISREQYRLQRASKVAKTDGQTPTTNQIEHNYRDNSHDRLPEKTHVHRGWPPMVINTSGQYKIISESPRAMCKHKKKHKK